jgi:hypothetical protein
VEQVLIHYHDKPRRNRNRPDPIGSLFIEALEALHAKRVAEEEGDFTFDF